jgi:putative transposase
LDEALNLKGLSKLLAIDFWQSQAEGCRTFLVPIMRKTASSRKSHVVNFKVTAKKIESIRLRIYGDGISIAYTTNPCLITYMARLSRITVPGLPHHVTQRGNRQQVLFTEAEDYALYRDLIAERCRANGVICWAYCLMPTHVHLILTPKTEDGLSRAVGEAHRRFTAYVNARARVTGHLFQARFASVAMDESHCLNAVRYLAFNPVKARLVPYPELWEWCSVKAHLAGEDDDFVRVNPILRLEPNFSDFLDLSSDEKLELDAFETRSMNGRPLGSPAFIARLEKKLGRTLKPQKRGPKTKQKEEIV